MLSLIFDNHCITFHMHTDSHNCYIIVMFIAAIAYLLFKNNYLLDKGQIILLTTKLGFKKNLVSGKMLTD